MKIYAIYNTDGYEYSVDEYYISLERANARIVELYEEELSDCDELVESPHFERKQIKFPILDNNGQFYKTTNRYTTSGVKEVEVIE